MEKLEKRLKTIASNGFFGNGNLLRVESSSDDGKGIGYASDIIFVRVVMKSEKGTYQELPVVVKVQYPPVDGAPADLQFGNEVFAYNKLIPALGADKIYLAPKLYFAESLEDGNPESDIIVLEDMRREGYKIAKELWLDKEHVELAMLKLGQFHGLSYKMKKTCPEKMNELRNGIIIRDKQFKPIYWVAMSLALHRGFKPVLDETHEGIAHEAYRKLSKAEFQDMWKNLQKPVEPFGAIVHGDYNKNNILYSYDDQGRVKDLKLFDFATAVYSDPAVDIAFFLYQNTSPELRDELWDTFLEIYWQGLTSVEADPGFSFEEFKVNFARRAIYGYIPVSFFLPTCMDPEFHSVDKFNVMTDGEFIEWGKYCGGQEANEATTSVVRHLLKKGYLEAYVHQSDF